MDIHDLAVRLEKHREQDALHFEKLHHKIDRLTHGTSAVSGETKMSEVRNVFEPGFGYGGGGMGSAGGGLGGGAIGGFLGAALGNGGFGFGNRHGGPVDYVTPMQLQTATGSIIDANQNTTLLQAVGDTKLAVSNTGSAVQLADAANTQAIRTHLGQVENTIGAMASTNLQAINGVNMNVLQSAAATREAVTASGTANLIATKDAQFALAAAIVADGEKTRAMLVAQNEAGLRTEITALQIRLQEQQAAALSRGTEVNVTQTVNQNQLQAQAQAQQQQQAILLNSIWNRLDGMQQAIATNSNMIIGNSGAVATGPNTANPVNVRA